MALSNSEGLWKAVDLLKIGLESGTIKLNGTGTVNPEAAANAARADAAYIDTFLTTVGANIVKASSK